MILALCEQVIRWHVSGRDSEMGYPSSQQAL